MHLTEHALDLPSAVFFYFSLLYRDAQAKSRFCSRRSRPTPDLTPPWLANSRPASPRIACGFTESFGRNSFGRTRALPHRRPRRQSRFLSSPGRQAGCLDHVVRASSRTSLGRGTCREGLEGCLTCGVRRVPMRGPSTAKFPRLPFRL